MNIFNKVALQGLKKNRTRTLVTIVGVALSAALITAVFTFAVSLQTYMINGSIAKYGDWHAAFLDADSAFMQKQSGDSRVVKLASFENIGYATLAGGKNEDKPYLFIAGFNQETFETLPVVLLSGRLPQNSSEILIPAHVASNGGVQISVGDTLTLAIGTRQVEGEILNQHDPYRPGEETLVPAKQKTYTVVGTCQRLAFEERSAPGYTLISTANTGADSDNLSLFVTLKKPSKIHAYADSAAGSHTCVLNEEVLRFMGLSGDTLFNTLLYTIGIIVVAIIMVGSVFLIYNAFYISVNERTHQFGILMSVGATEKQLRNSVLFEGICIGIAGIPIGILIGLGGMGLVLSVVAKKFVDILYTNVPLSLNVSFPAILGAVAVSMVTILISAYIPAKKAANMPVMECIRQTNEIKVEAKIMKTSKLAQHLYGLEGILALKNFKRNKKRYRSIVWSLILSVVLFISTSAFVIDLKQTSKQITELSTYDIGLGAQDMDDVQMLQLYDRLKKVEGVYESSYQACVDYFCTLQADELSDDYWEIAGEYPSQNTVELTMSVQFLDDTTYRNIIQELGLSTEEYTGQNAKMIALAKMENTDDQVSELNEFDDLFKNSSTDVVITPKTGLGLEEEQGQKVNITFVELVTPDIPPMTTGIYEQKPYIFQALAPWSLKEKLFLCANQTEVKVKGMTFHSETPARTTAEMKEVIEDAGITSTYVLLNMHEALEESRNYIFIANVFSYTFIVMISLIAVANVFNTISTNIKLRRRELAMLRSMGMSDRDFNKMMRFECMFYGMRALLVGLPLAVLCSWLIYKGMFTGGADNIDFVMPWTSIGISIFSVLLVIFVTMMYTTSKIRQENIIDALRDDMT